MNIDLVTGGTGLLGSHIAEQLRAAGRQVRVLVRPGADTSFLRSIGADWIEGDLVDSESCRRATLGVTNVYHAAAKVGDWGNWAEFQRGCLDATRNLAEASAENGVERFLHISSTSAYGHPTEGGPPIEEDAPLGQNLWPFWDYYTRSKVECERMLWGLSDRGRLPLTVIRPSWLYGERDRTTTARLVRRFRGAGIPLIGPGDNPLSAIYAGCVAEAAIQAARDSGSLGEAYNITDQGPITQREYLNLWAEALGVPSVRSSRNYRAVFLAAFALEGASRLVGRRTPPLITRYATWLMGRRIAYSTAKARSKLGWSPSCTYRESIARTVAWFEGRQAEPAGIGRSKG